MHPLLDRSLHPVVGHRGNAAHAPENTLESFRQAVALGVDALELDVRLAADGHVVVIHDPTVDRTTNGTGAVAGLTLKHLQRLDAGARFGADAGREGPWAGRGITVPSFDDILRDLPGVPLLIEIKTPDASRATREVIERNGATERCIVASFDHRAVIPFRGSGIKVGSSRWDAARLLLPALLRLTVRTPGFDVMCIPRYFHGIPLPVVGFARTLGRAGVLVHVWTVDDAATAQMLWHAGVRGIISNDPAAILRERRRLFGE